MQPHAPFNFANRTAEIRTHNPKIHKENEKERHHLHTGGKSSSLQSHTFWSATRFGNVCGQRNTNNNPCQCSGSGERPLLQPCAECNDNCRHRHAHPALPYLEGGLQTPDSYGNKFHLPLPCHLHRSEPGHGSTDGRRDCGRNS